MFHVLSCIFHLAIIKMRSFHCLQTWQKSLSRISKVMGSKGSSLRKAVNKIIKRHVDFDKRCRSDAFTDQVSLRIAYWTGSETTDQQQRLPASHPFLINALTKLKEIKAAHESGIKRSLDAIVDQESNGLLGRVTSVQSRLEKVLAHTLFSNICLKILTNITATMRPGYNKLLLNRNFAPC